ncbi:anti-sigma F factor [Tepidibacillus infernus]|uniref:Anti-sigma F factor n=1 Tax=Tepidibacillus decaturensis TaxID=1413211 RepID=A0A135L369_9BACI|nr:MULTISPECIES: anti-sigma F factor [Tepidibacillus]KXG43347.1 anti-sigma F factor [Tepidibacillus decaturensis]
MENFMRLQFASKSENESFARVAVAAFISQIDPTLDDLNDIKTVVSEAVTNAIIHGYDQEPNGMVEITVLLKDSIVEITIEDQGKGIEDVQEAIQPLFTTKPELERSGMGFTIMENFMDEMKVQSEVGKGTKVILRKELALNRIIS